MFLSEYGANVHSQFGDDGVIAEIFRRIGEQSRVCVEFGAGDGLTCSNTANLWKSGWHGLLIEADEDRATHALVNTQGFDCQVLNCLILTGGQTSIDYLCTKVAGLGDIDFMSIDVDGDDYWILTTMTIRPRVVCIEFNPTVPPHLKLMPTGTGRCFGVGASVMKEGGEEMGYKMIGITQANMYFVRADEAEAFSDMETDLTILQPPETFMYITTDVTGRVVPVGAPSQWGLRWPPSELVRWPEDQENLLEFDYVDAWERYAHQILVELKEVRAERGI